MCLTEVVHFAERLVAQPLALRQAHASGGRAALQPRRVRAQMGGRRARCVGVLCGRHQLNTMRDVGG
jgi:hypothetical protein